MSRESITTRGRQVAETGMIDACVIRRKTGETTNPNTGAVVPVYGLEVYSGKCRVQTRNIATQSSTVGQQRVDLFTSELQIPIAVVDVEVNDVVEITESFDPDLVGRTMRVTNLAYGTHKTARRLPLQEITS